MVALTDTLLKTEEKNREIADYVRSMRDFIRKTENQNHDDARNSFLIEQDGTFLNDTIKKRCHCVVTRTKKEKTLVKQ